MTDFIYLASQSPRRKQLLEQWGVRCELLLPDADEDAESLEAVLPGEAPAAYVQRVTGLKLAASLARLQRRGLPPAPVLCADTTVALGRRILGKPASAAWGVRKDDKELRAALSNHLKSLKQSPSWGQMMLRYFSEDALALLARARE